MANVPNASPDKRTERIIFLAALLVRGAFLLATVLLGIEFDQDNQRYNEQSTGILAGDLDLETEYFITAPLYPYTQALFKLVLGKGWLVGLTLVQWLLCAWSAVYLWRIALRFFDRRVALVAAALYVVFPLTLIWVGTPAQDMPFLIALIFALHAWFRAVNSDHLGRTIGAGALFALTFLIKSHILLFAPFMPIYWWWNGQATARRRVQHIAAFVCTCFVFTLPYGLYNLRKHDMYVISSTGQGGFFMVGHNEDVYRFIVDPPPLGTPEHRRIFNMQYRIMDELRDTLATLPHKEKQAVMLRAGIDWCRANPGKLAELSAWDLAYFLLPGVNPHHYGKATWAALFLISLPLYLLAYAGVWMALRENFRKHAWILALMLAMTAFSVVFYVQNRFRTITLEPYYIIYASFALVRLARRLGLDRRWPRLKEPVMA
ncbi:MAG: glycosyltransferase family 39 protein [Flavobacteriales bacterium]|nr:glycosyltransferase family 39 protein [Flavobacteriales bacterium]